jgi:hypothetical protein
MVEVFKTDVHEQKQVALLNALSARFPMLKINFDLEDCDRILRVEGADISTDKIMGLLHIHGHMCEVLE